MCREIKVPAEINRSALNRACVIRWKNAKLGSIIAILDIITPSWLRVDRAMIFFISVSAIAAIPAINMVDMAIIIIKKWNV